MDSVPLVPGDALVVRQPEVHRTDHMSTSELAGRWRLAVGFKVVERKPALDSVYPPSELLCDFCAVQTFGAATRCLLPSMDPGQPPPEWYNMSRYPRRVSNPRRAASPFAHLRFEPAADSAAACPKLAPTEALLNGAIDHAFVEYMNANRDHYDRKDARQGSNATCAAYWHEWGRGGPPAPESILLKVGTRHEEDRGGPRDEPTSALSAWRASVDRAQASKHASRPGRVLQPEPQHRSGADVELRPSAASLARYLRGTRGGRHG